MSSRPPSSYPSLTSNSSPSSHSHQPHQHHHQHLQPPRQTMAPPYASHPSSSLSSSSASSSRPPFVRGGSSARASLPIPPSLLEKPYLHQVTLPPTPAHPPSMRHTSSNKPAHHSSSSSYARGPHQGSPPHQRSAPSPIVSRQDTWLADTVPAAFDTGDGKAPKSRHRGATDDRPSSSSPYYPHYTPSSSSFKIS